MNKLPVFLLALLLGVFVLSGPAYAGLNKDAEINHLVNFISHSGCLFIRNNTEHSAHDARKHIENKYQYIKSRVANTEDFIKYAATKSSMSGKLYQVRCNGELQPTWQWLTNELERYRKNNP